LPVGEGIEVLEKGHLAVAAEDGALTTRAKGIALSKLYTVPGDVSYRTGNIEFNGTIDVGANVLSGFELKAEGDIIVRGIVEGAHLEALGSITVFGGIHGGGKGILKSGGNITAKFANEVTLEAAGDILLQTQMLNCHVLAQGSVCVQGTQGAIVGGEIRSGKSITTSFLGSPRESKTIVQIGLDSDLPKRLSKNDDELQTLKKRLVDLDTILNKLQTFKDQGGILDSGKEALRVKVVQEKFQVKGRVDVLEKELEGMRLDLQKIREGFVEVRDTVHSGSTVKIGSDAYLVDHDLRYTTFYYERGEIHTRAD
jgi:uncharacterized protein (DUF342 family)